MGGFFAETGFTLIEVALTIALLGIILALVLPRFGSTSSVAESSRRLIGTIQSLYSAAASSSRTYRLNIDLDQHIYWATVLTSDGDRVPTDPLLAFRTALLSPVRFEDVTVGRHGKVMTGKVFIQFFPGGRTDHAVIHLSNQTDQRLAMVLNPLTGGIQVSDRYSMEAPNAWDPELYREFFKALPLPPSLPLQQSQQVQPARQP